MPRPELESNPPYVSKGYKNYCFNIEHPSPTRGTQLIPEKLPKFVNDLFYLSKRALVHRGFTSTQIQEYTQTIANGKIPHGLPSINHFNELLKLTIRDS